ncbi:MAG: hypothetical protein FWH05_03495 [Oscillospiraceae bacterium]|nr:hypothetical protein [Oscillospiraceae bacterium]
MKRAILILVGIILLSSCSAKVAPNNVIDEVDEITLMTDNTTEQPQKPDENEETAEIEEVDENEETAEIEEVDENEETNEHPETTESPQQGDSGGPLLIPIEGDNMFEVPPETEVLEMYWDIVSETQDGKTMNEIIYNLMCRNILVIKTGIWSEMFEFKNEEDLYEIIDNGFKRNTRGHFEITSDYFNSPSDIVDLARLTLVKEAADEFSVKTNEVYIIDENGRFLRSAEAGSAPPGYLFFRYNTPIEIISVTEDTCEFICYLNDTTHSFYYEGVVYNIFNEKKGMAVKENGEWRLKYLIYGSSEVPDAYPYLVELKGDYKTWIISLFEALPEGYVVQKSQFQMRE